jgi:hypothetical protein
MVADASDGRDDTAPSVFTVAGHRRGMERLRALGAVLSVLALAGYGLGIVVAYPGRALSITLLMVGVTLLVVGGTA